MTALAAGALAQCHPTRKPYQAGLCRRCFEDAKALAIEEHASPGLVLGGHYRADPREQPVRCPKCRAAPPMWVADAVAGVCRICGADWFHALIPLRPPRDPPLSGGPLVPL